MRQRKLDAERVWAAWQARERSRERSKKRKAVLVHRIRAALQATGRSRQQLSKAARVSHATLSRLVRVRSRTKAVRTGTLHALSRALRVPPEWLTGERQDLPYVAEWDFLRREGEEDPSRWERPTADDVRWSWLMEQAEKAIRRDLGEWHGQEARDVYDAWGHGLLNVVARLGSSIVWRSATLESSPRGSGYALGQCDNAPSVSWLEHVLEPWFDGTAYLNADLLRGVFQALRAEAAVQLLSETGDQDAMRALERYAAASSKFYPPEERYAVLGPDED